MRKLLQKIKVAYYKKMMALYSKKANKAFDGGKALACIYCGKVMIDYSKKYYVAKQALS